jgi:hypothetical protein
MVGTPSPAQPKEGGRGEGMKEYEGEGRHWSALGVRGYTGRQTIREPAQFLSGTMSESVNDRAVTSSSCLGSGNDGDDGLYLKVDEGVSPGTW